MDSQKAKKIVWIASFIWFLLGLVLACGAYLKWISLDVFKVAFAACFIVYAVLVTLLTRFMYGP